MLCYAGPAGENIGLAAGSQEEARTCDVGVLSAWEGQSDVTPEIPMETVAYNKQSPHRKNYIGWLHINQARYSND
jgi:hypothetical protein